MTVKPRNPRGDPNRNEQHRLEAKESPPNPGRTRELLLGHAPLKIAAELKEAHLQRLSETAVPGQVRC